MFTPTEIEALPSAMEQLYRSLQLNIMSDLTERLKANGEEITSAADWQINRLYELGVSKDEIDSLIQSTLNVSDDEIDRIYDEVVKSGYARNEELYTSKGKEYIPYAENKQLQQLVKAVKNQTKSEYRNITGSLGFAVRNADNTLSFTPLADFYQRTLDNGLMQIVSGAVDYNTVLKKAVKAMTDSGLRTVDYASGWSNRVDVAARRALVTGFNQVVAKVNEDNAEQLGTEYFEVSYHRGARPTHQVWQGRVYSKKELETVCGLGTVTGLCGANCYHSYSPFIKGIDTPTYSEEELDRMNEEENTPKEYNGKTYTAYEAQQRQRQLETAMRADRQKIELLTQGGADDDTITGAKAKYFQRQDEYVKFSKAVGLPQQWERVTVSGKNALGSKLPKKAGDINKISGDTVEKSVDYMSKSFRPKFSPPSSIDFNNNSIKIKKVENSKFDIVTDIENTRRNKAVRLTEKLLDSISNNLPVEMELPKVAVIDFEKNNFGIDAIGGYDKSTGILYVNSKYDTASKIISYVNKQKDMFANKTEFAPLLHELGHKYYYDCIKNLAKVKNIEYNKAKGIIDEKILSYIQNKGISKNLDTLISEYAQSGYDRHKYTEIVAEVFTVPEKELASDLINLVGE
jgi:phage minor capsid protein 2